MNCKDYQKQIISYLDGELHQSIAYDLEEHMKGCPECEESFNILMKAYNLIEVEKSEFKLDSFMSARILARLKDKESRYSSKVLNLRYYTVASLAAAGIAIGILIGSLYSTDSSIQTSSTQEWEQLADEYMPEIDNNPYNLVTITNETPSKP